MMRVLSKTKMTKVANILESWEKIRQERSEEEVVELVVKHSLT
jgi:hypothetical protein